MLIPLNLHIKVIVRLKCTEKHNMFIFCDVFYVKNRYTTCVDLSTSLESWLKLHLWLKVVLSTFNTGFMLFSSEI